MPEILKATVSRGPLETVAFGRSFSLPFVPASDWLQALASEEPVTEVFPGMLSENDYESVVDLLEDDSVTLKDLRTVAFKVIANASGFRWWEALNLVGIANRDSGLMGELTLRGVDPDTIPFGRWCAAAHSALVRGMDEKERAKWEARFSAPPPMEEAMEEESLDFQDVVKSLQGIPGARIG